MQTKPLLFVGITTWNSDLFIETCIQAVKRFTDPASTEIVVWDNESTDDTVAIAKAHGVKVISCRCPQARALNELFSQSRAIYTLLIHSDVVLLDPRWLDVCAKYLVGNVALVSPEDIGCGPYTRPWGKDKPESSFLLFRTELARDARIWTWTRKFLLRWPSRTLNFFGEHVTYNLPKTLEAKGLYWQPMAVHTSTVEDAPLFTPSFTPKYWQDSLSHFRYGLGNFYSLDGIITHYHNWFDREVSASKSLEDSSTETIPRDGGLPAAFVKSYSLRFLADANSSKIVIPNIS